MKNDMKILEFAINNIKSELSECGIQAKNKPSQYKDGLVDGLNRALRSLEGLKESFQIKRCEKSFQLKLEDIPDFRVTFNGKDI